MSDDSAARWLKWTPEPGQGAFVRVGDAEEERTELALDELLLTLPEGGAPATVTLRFRVTVEDYQRMESERWFNIPVGFSEALDIAFDPAQPVELEVVTAPLLRGGYPLEFVFGEVTDDDQRLAMVVAPFLDAEAMSTVNNPLMYEVVRVWQPAEDGTGSGFGRDAVEAWENRFALR